MNTTLAAGRVTTHTDAVGIATISFYHPAHNSLPGALLTKLAQAITALGQAETTRVIVLESEGERTFCAGASFDELLAIRDEAAGLGFFSGFASVINACRICPRIIIGRVQGRAIGGGVGLAAATDYCLASTQAAVKLSELVVGIGPFVVGPVVELKIGRAAYAQLALDAAEFRPAEWALAKGLYASLHDTPAALDAAVAALAARLAAYHPAALAELKKVLWEGTAHWAELLPARAAISGRLVRSEFTQAAISAFKQGAR